MRAAIYSRVSTSDKGQDVTLQTDEIREYCQRRGFEIAGEYIDEGFSGSKASRPALNRLMADAKQCRFDVLVVWKLDRFSRSLAHLVLTLQEFESLGISFVSLRDAIDLTTAQGKLLFGILGSLAEFERSLIAERVKAGMAHARKQGKRLGRPQLDCGENVKALRQQGWNITQIAKHFNVSRTSVYALLQQ